MLLEIAVGDAYGACFEWTEKWIITLKNDLKYLTLEENPSLIKPGNYTDDTQMSIAIAEAMADGNNWAAYDLAQKFIECFHRDQRRGYAPGFYLFLLDHTDGLSFLKDIHPTSTRSGAAMRAAPIGLCKDIGLLKHKCILQSGITHNTQEGIHSALWVSLAVHYLFYELGPKAGLIEWLTNKVHCPFTFEHLRKYDHIPVEGWPCVLAALEAVMNYNDLASILKACINYAGDTDTIAAIAMGIASVSKEIEQNLPKNLIDGLENGKYGRDYLINLDRRLFEKFTKTSVG